jgi:hypothetical protein
VLVEEFRLTPMGAFRDPAWRTSPPDADLSIVAVPTSVDRSLRVGSTPDGRPAVACRALDASDGRVTLDTTLRVDGAEAAGPLLSIGDGRGAALLGRDDRSRLALADGVSTSGTDLRIRSGEWYRLVVEVDLDAGTYAVEAGTVDRDASRMTRTGLAVGPPLDDADGLCFATAGAADASITIDEIRVTAR